MSKTWLRSDGDDCIILVHVQPGSRRTEIVGQHGDALKIRLAAPPVDGKANEALLAFLAEKLAVTRRQVELRSGATSRRKSVVVRLSVAAAESLLDVAQDLVQQG